MKGKIKYTDEPIGKVKVISDFLPSPEELALKDETVKVTISLSKASIEWGELVDILFGVPWEELLKFITREL